MLRRTLASSLIVVLVGSLVLLGACRRTEPPADTFTLTVATDGTGAGRVVSDPAGIDVTSATAPAAAVYDGGSLITLTAVPDAGSVFGGWTGGGCSGTDPCTITLTTDTEVTATFAVAVGEADVREALSGFDSNLGQIGPDVVTGDAFLAMDALLMALASFGPGGLVPLPPEDPFLPDGLLRRLAAHELPRGVFEYDPELDEWDLVEPSELLELRWTFFDLEDVERDAVLMIDWGATTTVDDYGELTEVPTDDMSASLSVDGAQVAAFDVGFAWFSAPECPDGILEPTSFAIDGSIGTEATLTLNGVGFRLTPILLDTSGEIVMAAGGDAVGVVWDIALDVTVDRAPDCYIDDFAVTGGSLAVTTYSDRAGTRSSLGLNLTFGNLEIDPDLGPIAVDLEGGLDIDGVPAVSFAGTLDDEDGDGIPGDNLILTFADGETMTLEAFLEEQFDTAARAVTRAWSTLR
jgi:hypothetical protein